MEILTKIFLARECAGKTSLRFWPIMPIIVNLADDQLKSYASSDNQGS